MYIYNYLLLQICEDIMRYTKKGMVYGWLGRWSKLKSRNKWEILLDDVIIVYNNNNILFKKIRYFIKSYQDIHHQPLPSLGSLALPHCLLEATPDYKRICFKCLYYRNLAHLDLNNWGEPQTIIVARPQWLAWKLEFLPPLGIFLAICTPQ